MEAWRNDPEIMSDDDDDDDVLFRDDNDDDVLSYHSSPSNTEQLDYEELQSTSSYQAPSEDYVGVGCEINHPSQVQHMDGCLADSSDKTGRNW